MPYASRTLVAVITDPGGPPATIWPSEIRWTVLQTRGKYLTVGNPVKMSDSITEVKRSPLLGEHTEEIFWARCSAIRPRRSPTSKRRARSRRRRSPRKRRRRECDGCLAAARC